MITRGIFLAGLILGLLATPSLIAQDKKEEKKDKKKETGKKWKKGKIG